jgi:hypothetical protein
VKRVSGVREVKGVKRVLTTQPLLAEPHCEKERTDIYLKRQYLLLKYVGRQQI